MSWIKYLFLHAWSCVWFSSNFFFLNLSCKKIKNSTIQHTLFWVSDFIILTFTSLFEFIISTFQRHHIFFLKLSSIYFVCLDIFYILNILFCFIKSNHQIKWWPNIILLLIIPLLFHNYAPLAPCSICNSFQFEISQ